MKYIKSIKILTIILFIIAISSSFSKSTSTMPIYTKEYKSENGVLLVMNSNSDLYKEYLDISLKIERLNVKLLNKNLNYFVVDDPEANKEMLIIKDKNNVFVLNYEIGEETIPYELLKTNNIMSNSKYNSIIQSI